MLFIIKDLFFLLKTGYVLKNNNKKFLFFVKSFFLLFTFKIFSIILVILFFKIVPFEMPRNNAIREATNSSPLLTLIELAIIAPIIEEISFRLNLLFSKINFALSTCFLSFIAITLIYNIGVFEISNESLYRAIFSVSLGIIIYINLIYFVENRLMLFWKKNKLFIFYTSLSLFSIPHVLNFELNEVPFWFIPIIVLPMVSSGIVYSYLRLKQGILSSLLLHSLVNLLPYLIFQLNN